MSKFICLMTLVLFGLMIDSTEAARKPNILFAFADDWGRHASAYAKIDGAGTENDVVRTPNFDALAKSGVLFRNAFVNAPSCTPCRSSLLSGQHFWRTGRAAILQGAIWDQSIPTWPFLLQDNGYHIGYTYKVWSPGSPRDAGYGGPKNSYHKSGSQFNSFSQTATRLVESGKSIEQAKQSLGDIVRGNIQQFLASKQDDVPFAYWFGPTNVHRKWIKDSGLAIWNIDPDDLIGKLPPFLPDVPEVRQDFADYLGEAQAFDMALGILVEELKKAGEFENTIIAISGDHGPAGFPHGKCNLYDFGTRVPLVLTGPGIQPGRVVDDFVSLPDLAPTFLEAGGVQAPEVMTARTLWPVLKSKSEGLVDKNRTQVFIGRERHVALARAGQLPYPQRAIRTNDYLFVINFRPNRYPLGDHYQLDSNSTPSIDSLTNNTFCTIPDEDAGPAKAWLVTHRNDPRWSSYFQNAYGKRPREELFDLKEDPHQMHNVAADLQYQSVVKKLRDQLMQELRSTNDPRLINNGKFFETAPMAGPLPIAPKRKKKI
ncbi:MAG: sulfatase [Planctomycetaceae bacterium]|nr:sulfatase [Planctomycetaceae bacterium]